MPSRRGPAAREESSCGDAPDGVAKFLGSDPVGGPHVIVECDRFTARMRRARKNSLMSGAPDLNQHLAIRPLETLGVDGAQKQPMRAWIPRAAEGQGGREGPIREGQ